MVGKTFLRRMIELFHTIQFAYGSEEYLDASNPSPSRWWLEASAVYQQGLVVPEGSDYLEFFSTLWATSPWLSLEVYDDGGHQYGRFLWPLSIEASLQESDWHRRFWEQLDGRSGYRLPDEFDLFLLEEQTSFPEEYRRFLARAAVGAFPRYDFLFGIRDLNNFVSLPNATTAEYSALELPVAGEVLASHTEAPQTLGANYVWFGASQAEAGRALVVHFESDAEHDGEPVEWAVELVAVRSNAIVDRYSLEPHVPSGPGALREGHVRLDGYVPRGNLVAARPVYCL